MFGHLIGNIWFDKSSDLSVVYPDFAGVWVFITMQTEHGVCRPYPLTIAPMVRPSSSKRLVASSVNAVHPVSTSLEKVTTSVHGIVLTRDVSAKEAVYGSESLIDKLVTCNNVVLFLYLPFFLQRLFSRRVFRDYESAKQFWVMPDFRFPDALVSLRENRAVIPVENSRHITGPYVERRHLVAEVDSKVGAEHSLFTYGAT